MGKATINNFNLTIASYTCIFYISTHNKCFIRQKIGLPTYLQYMCVHVYSYHCCVSVVCTCRIQYLYLPTVQYICVHVYSYHCCVSVVCTCRIQYLPLPTVQYMCVHVYSYHCCVSVVCTCRIQYLYLQYSTCVYMYTVITAVCL